MTGKQNKDNMSIRRQDSETVNSEAVKQSVSVSEAHVKNLADFRTALVPDSENNELAEPIRLENELIRAWRKSKTSSYRLNVLSSYKRVAFTLAEVLITLGIIGVVAAVSLPTLLTNIQERVRKEQLRSAKYKLTLATDKMKSLGLLENTYPTTQDFINELKKHFKIAMVCDNSHLTDCWPSDKIEIPTTSGMTTINVSSLQTGADIKALGIGTRATETVGIITADGVPMIMTYSPKCTPLDSVKTYSWSTVDNKPETNATTNCISAIMDINGTGKPNRLGKDVRTLNSMFGYVEIDSYEPITREECSKLKDKLGISECFRRDDSPSMNTDYWGGAVKACYDLGLHLPSTQTLANIAGARCGVSDVAPDTIIASGQYDNTSALDNILGQFWSNALSTDYPKGISISRDMSYVRSHQFRTWRNLNDFKALCVGD